MLSQKRKLHGFTLVELLVVISIIGMLMALLLPAVQAARETARANTCRNNMRNVGLAMVQYDSNRQVWPGYNNRIANANGFGTVGSNGNGDRSFAFVILPYMDHRAMYDALIAPTAVGDTEGILNSAITQSIEVFTCPSNPPEAAGTAPMAYVVNSGQIDATTAVNNAYDNKANGVFLRGNYASPVVSSSAFIAGGDGLGTTIMLSENSDAGTWTGMQDLTSAGTTERFLGFTYTTSLTPPAAPAGTTEPLGINIAFGQSKSGGSPATTAGYTRPAAFHPGFVNVMFCDSHVRNISDTISYGVFQALCTAKGSSATMGPTSTTLMSATNHPGSQVPDEAAIR